MIDRRIATIIAEQYAAGYWLMPSELADWVYESLAYDEDGDYPPPQLIDKRKEKEITVTDDQENTICFRPNHHGYRIIIK